MTDYTEAALRGATVRLNDGEVVVIGYVRAGEDGWIDPVIISWCDHDDYMTWDLAGTALGHGADIVEIVQ
jgi:hypothetical protein